MAESETIRGPRGEVDGAPRPHPILEDVMAAGSGQLADVLQDVYPRRLRNVVENIDEQDEVVSVGSRAEKGPGVD